MDLQLMNISKVQNYEQDMFKYANLIVENFS